MDRRQFLALGATAGLGAVAGCTFEQASESPGGRGPEIALETVVEDASFPVDMAFLPDGNRLVVQRSGQVMRHTDAGLESEPFLDLRDQMAEIKGERGLVGFALHPDFAENRRFYVRYSAPLRESMPADYSHTAALAEFRATADLTGVLADSERLVFEIPEPGENHNAGDLAFGPDGYLYAALGDGQRTNFAEENDLWWFDQGANAQNITDNRLGGILRLDIDTTTDDHAYGIPPDNPLVGERGRDEYFAWGLRNPYRISFDDGRLFVGDVGEHIRESVYLVERGENYGWPVVEGSSCPATTSIGHAVTENPLNVLNPKTWVAQTNRISPVKVCPTPDNTDGEFPEPLVEYNRPGARAVTGGYVYRGEAIPELQGKYIFGDFIAPIPLWALDNPGEGERPQQISELVVSGTDSGRIPKDSLLSFARDPQGELYVLLGSGRIDRLTSPA
jgi:glucose/arabinose dehydrogenase